MKPVTEPELRYLDYRQDFLTKVDMLADNVRESGWIPEFIIGIGRGGLVPAVYLSNLLKMPMLSIDHSSKVPGFADELLAKVSVMTRSGLRMLFVDDINDSGGTIEYIRALLAENGCDTQNIRFAVIINNQRSSAKVDFWIDMIDRAEDKQWFVFPWESMSTRENIVAEALSVPERLS